MLIGRRLFGISKVCAKEGFRYALNAVNVARRSGRAFIEAADGKTAVRASFQERDESAFPIKKPESESAKCEYVFEDFDKRVPRDVWDECAKAIPKHATTREQECGRIVDGENKIQTTTPDGKRVRSIEYSGLVNDKFPTLDKVFPDYSKHCEVDTLNVLKPAARVRVKAEDMIQVFQALDKMKGDREHVAMTIPLENAGGPIYFQTVGHDGENIEALVMPLGKEDDPDHRLIGVRGGG